MLYKRKNSVFFRGKRWFSFLYMIVQNTQVIDCQFVDKAPLFFIISHHDKKVLKYRLEFAPKLRNNMTKVSKKHQEKRSKTIET